MATIKTIMLLLVVALVLSFATDAYARAQCLGAGQPCNRILPYQCCTPMTCDFFRGSTCQMNF
uniref:Ptu1-like peptide pp12 n=1 Tax=Pristhesancus plagipennis TaxID=1955184 RepID=A0A1Q1NP67_PRIPG|nr:ptu1-like peptide pp12 [Pristhesancus plagipennis]